MRLYHFNNLGRHDMLKHAVTMRDVREPLEFSLAYHTGQDHDAVLANRKKFGDFFGSGVSFVSPLQVHGESIHAVSSRDDYGWYSFDPALQADALVTDEPDVALTILTADCVPILLYDPVQMAIGAVHAGWQGSELMIAVKTVEKMNRLYGSEPEDIVVGIGPSIGGCCYEVGEDVAKRFFDYGDAVKKANRDGKYLLDLKMVNHNQLAGIGVRESNIETSEYCTVCHNDLFFSYRKESGTAGRFMSAIGIRY